MSKDDCRLPCGCENSHVKGNEEWVTDQNLLFWRGTSLRFPYFGKVCVVKVCTKYVETHNSSLMHCLCMSMRMLVMCGTVGAGGGLLKYFARRCQPKKENRICTDALSILRMGVRES
jgi:hypothetical protein